MIDRVTWADVWRYAREDRGRMARLLCILAMFLLILAAIAVVAVISS